MAQPPLNGRITGDRAGPSYQLLLPCNNPVSLSLKPGKVLPTSLFHNQQSWKSWSFVKPPKNALLSPKFLIFQKLHLFQNSDSFQHLFSKGLLLTPHNASWFSSSPICPQRPPTGVHITALKPYKSPIEHLPSWHLHAEAFFTETWFFWNTRECFKSTNKWINFDLFFRLRVGLLPHLRETPSSLWPLPPVPISLPPIQ